MTCRIAAMVLSLGGVLAIAAPAMAQNTPAPASKWSSQCSAEARQGPFTCSMQQSAVVSQTGQLVASIAIRVAPTGGPVLNLQVPLGLYLPAGVTLQVDDKPAQAMALDTCDADGCFVSKPLDDALLQALRAGAKLTVTVQNFSRKPLAVPFELAGFTAAYQKIQP